MDRKIPIGCFQGKGSNTRYSGFVFLSLGILFALICVSFLLLSNTENIQAQEPGSAVAIYKISDDPIKEEPINFSGVRCMDIHLVGSPGELSAFSILFDPAGKQRTSTGTLNFYYTKNGNHPVFLKKFDFTPQAFRMYRFSKGAPMVGLLIDLPSEELKKDAVVIVKSGELRSTSKVMIFKQE